MILLFGNAFGAQATAYQLTGGTLTIVPIIIGAQISGDVLHNPGLGYAMAMGMVVIMTVSIVFYPSSSGGRALAAMRPAPVPVRLGLVFAIALALLLPAALRDVRLLAEGEPAFASTRTRARVRRPKFFGEPSLFADRRRGHDHRQRSPDRADRLLGPPAPAAALRPIVEFVTLLPLVIPAVVLVFGYLRVYSRPPIPLTHTDIGSRCCSSSATSCCRCRTCTGRSTRASQRSTSGA